MKTQAVFWRIIHGELPLAAAAKTTGWEFVRYDDDTGEIHVAFAAGVPLTNPLGNIQGGMLAAMLDECMGPALYLTLPPNKIAVTVQQSTRFMRPARPGRLLGVGKVDHRTGSLCFTSGTLCDTEGRVLATGAATFRIGNLRWNGLTIPAAFASGLIERKLRRQRPPDDQAS